MHDADDELLAGSAVAEVAADEVEESRTIQLENRASAFEFGDRIQSVAAVVIGAAHHQDRVVLVLKV